MAHADVVRLARAMLLGGLMVAAPGHATDGVHACIDRISARFAIEPLPLELLLEVEGGAVGSVRRNGDGSEDLGPMQVNTVHLPMFAALGISREDLRDNRDCRNVLAATLLYLRHLRDSGGDAARAIARYHSKTPRHALRYLLRVQGVIERRRAANGRMRSRRTDAIPAPDRSDHGRVRQDPAAGHGDGHRDQGEQ